MEVKDEEKPNSEEERVPGEEINAEEIRETPSEEQTAEAETPAKSDLKKASAEEALKNFEGRTIEAPKKKKFGWLGYAFLLVAIGLGIYLMFNIVNDMGEAKTLGEVLAGADWVFAVISLAVLLTIIVCECMKYVIVMRTTTGRFNLRASIKVAFLGKFYDNVTPFAAGGQPMQIYYLHKKGYSGGISSAVILIRYFAQMFCWTIVSLLLMACNTSVLQRLGDSAWETVIMVSAWFGLVVNMLLPLMIVLFAILPQFAHALVNFVITVGYKIKIVKDKEKAMENAQKVVSDFRAGFRIMAHKPLNLLLLIVFNLVEVLFSFAFPYFVLRTFSALPEGSGFAVMISVMALNVYSAQSVTVIPTPGNSGAMEVVVTKSFAAVASAAVLSWSVLVWRFAVYYIYIIIGIGLTVFEFIRKIVRANRKKKAELQNSTTTDDK